MNRHRTRQIQLVVNGLATSDGAGVELLRVIGQPALPQLDPFLLFDSFRSDDPEDYIAGFPSHPHRGFETVTYLLNGRMRHRDNVGNEGVIKPGGVQWMTAGKGIVHSEMPEQEDGMLQGFQLWINLPGSHKMTEPQYQEHDQVHIPVETGPQSRVRVISGTTRAGTRGPVLQPLTDPLYLDISLDANTRFEENLPVDHNAFVYIIEGSIEMSDENAAKHTLGRDQLAVLGKGDAVELRSGDEATRLLLVAGKPLNEPVVRAGPFVMNTQEELKQAFDDYQKGNF